MRKFSGGQIERVACERVACECKRDWVQVPRSTPATQSDGLPHKEKVDGAKCHTPVTQSEGRCRQALRLPHKVKVDVAKCHACQVVCVCVCVCVCACVCVCECLCVSNLCMCEFFLCVCE